MAQDPGVIQVEEARRSLRASVLEAGHDLLAGPCNGRMPRKLPVASPSPRRIVRAADEYIRANPAQAANLARLALAIGASSWSAPPCAGLRGGHLPGANAEF